VVYTAGVDHLIKKVDMPMFSYKCFPVAQPLLLRRLPEEVR
jgi:hypothetical protein